MIISSSYMYYTFFFFFMMYVLYLSKFLGLILYPRNTAYIFMTTTVHEIHCTFLWLPLLRETLPTFAFLLLQQMVYICVAPANCISDTHSAFARLLLYQSESSFISLLCTIPEIFCLYLLYRRVCFCLNPMYYIWETLWIYMTPAIQEIVWFCATSTISEIHCFRRTHTRLDTLPTHADI